MNLQHVLVHTVFSLKQDKKVAIVFSTCVTFIKTKICLKLSFFLNSFYLTFIFILFNFIYSIYLILASCHNLWKDSPVGKSGSPVWSETWEDTFAQASCSFSITDRFLDVHNCVKNLRFFECGEHYHEKQKRTVGSSYFQLCLSSVHFFYI